MSELKIDEVDVEPQGTFDEERDDGYRIIDTENMETKEEKTTGTKIKEGVTDVFGFIWTDEALTPRAIISGILIGILVATMNVNFGLKTGWTQGGCIFAAIASFGMFKIIRPALPFSKEEAVITTTTAAAVGHIASAGGLISSIPALKMLGHTYNVWQLMLWAFSVGYFGVYFAVPMRRQMIEVDKLAFPSGTVTAETIKAMFSDGEDTIKKSTALFIFGGGSALYALASYFIPFLEKPPMPTVLVKWGWVLYLNPLLIGGGMLTGFRASFSLILGAIIGWAILGPIVQYNHWVTGAIMKFDGVRGWILWVGVAVMTADSLMTLIFSAKTIIMGGKSIIESGIEFIRKLTKEGWSIFKENPEEEDDGSIPALWWIVGLIFSTILLCFVGHFIFDIKFYFVLLAVPLSALLSIIAVRCVGEIDINPVGGMGKITQLVYAGIAPHQITTNLLSAGIVAAGASQCGDLMADLKTGHLLKVKPRKQYIAQCIGVIFGILVCVPIYKLFDTAYEIGGDEMPAPAAHAWKAVAEILSEGVSNLPLHSPWGMLGGAIFGIVLAAAFKVLGFWRKDVASFIPNALAIGIGFIVPPKQSLAMFIGAAGLLIWKKVAPKHAEFFYFTVASGMVAGEGIMGIVIALLKLIGIQPVY
eukprot:gene4337-7693_t